MSRVLKVFSVAVDCSDLLQGDEEVRNARQKVLEAVRTEDIRKMRRYLNRYSTDMLLVSGTASGCTVTSLSR